MSVNSINKIIMKEKHDIQFLMKYLFLYGRQHFVQDVD
jgi:hypothetical protein